MSVELRRKFEKLLKLYYNKRGNKNKNNIIYHKFEKFQISGAFKNKRDTSCPKINTAQISLRRNQKKGLAEGIIEGGAGEFPSALFNRLTPQA